MKLTQVLLTLLCVIGISIGQILFKKAAAAMQPAAGWMAWVFNGWLVTAVVLYGITTLLWVYILRTAPLSLAYPFMGLAFVFVPLISLLVLGEPLKWQTLLGGCLILAGVAVAAGGEQ